MPKRYMRSRRRHGGTAARFARAIQTRALTIVRKRYTKTFTIDAVQGQDVGQNTISHIGGRNSAFPNGTITIYDVDQDGQASSDMELYQFFKITGVAFKIFFPEGTEASKTPVQWSMGYSNSEVLYPPIDPERLQTLATYQTSACSARTPISRYFQTGTALSRQGVEWCNTAEYSDFDNVPPTSLYNQQLGPDAGSSTNIKVFRPRTDIGETAQLARLQVTYYIMYKGTKGLGSLIAP